MKYINFEVSIFMSSVTALLAKHAKLTLGDVTFNTFFPVQVAVNLKAKEFSCFHSFVLLSYPILRLLAQVLLLVQNFMTFVLSEFNVSLLALNHLFTH
jgi:hypothetical protein